MASAVGAVVLGGDYQGLAIARSLGRRGIPVCVVDDEHSIARFSRYTGRAVHVTDLRDEGRTVETVLALGERFGLEGWVLFPTREETVAALSRHRDRLRERFRIPTASWEVVRWAWDKRNTYRRAQQLGIPTPRTWYPQSANDVAEVDADPPFVVKPAIKEHFFYATKAKAWRADSRAELRGLIERALTILDPSEVMVQELVPGDGRDQFAYCALFKDGEALATMTCRRRRQHPPEFGRASTYVETVNANEIEGPSERFLRDIDYYGLAELEYKRDPRDGRQKLLDVNARTWGYHSLGQRAGVDFPALLYADQLGESLEPRRARAGVRWVRLATDIPTGLLEVARRRLGCRAYVRSVLRADTEAVFDRRDPLPSLAEAVLIPYLAVRRGF
jgi:predicted ATP-grasp superfamily ATP-dependent carboligase